MASLPYAVSVARSGIENVERWASGLRKADLQCLLRIVVNRNTTRRRIPFILAKGLNLPRTRTYLPKVPKVPCDGVAHVLYWAEAA